jgi:plasmid stability protein
MTTIDFGSPALQIGGRKEDSMATLNIKNFPDPLYKKLKARAKRQNRSVSQEVTRILATAVEEQEELSILDLQGLGKELWKGIDAAKYVSELRDSWD